MLRHQLPHPAPNSRAFSLVEMLAVIAILGVLAAAAVPSLKGIITGNNAGNATVRLSGFIEQARQYATANDTYVYVSIRSQTDDAGLPILQIAAVASNDGTDISSNGTANITLGSAANNARQIDAVMRLKGFVTRGKGSVSTTVVPRPDPTAAVDINSATATMGPISGQTYPVSFWFGPDGTANVSSTLPSRLEMAIEPNQQMSAANADAWATVIQIAGLTGTVRVYRAN